MTVVNATRLNTHQSEQLVLQALLSDAEVDQRGLGCHLGLEVGVGQLGLEVQAELGVVLHLESGSTAKWMIYACQISRMGMVKQSPVSVAGICTINQR